MYSYVCVAGTFDGIHAGHEALLHKAFEVGERVMIGLTSDAYVEQFKSKNLKLKIHGYDERKIELTGWLQKHGYETRAIIVPIDDPFEPAVSAKDVEALVVSEETERRGTELNEKRSANGLAPVALIVVPLVTTPIGAKISSSDRYTMPESLRHDLSAPLGPIVHTLKKDVPIITVGDMTTKTALDAGITPRLMIVDGKVERKAFPDLQPMFNVQKFRQQTFASGPGFISASVSLAIQQFFLSYSSQPQGLEAGPRVMKISGEEDLLVLPVIQYAPVGAVVYYGQPGHGIVEVVVTDDIKRHVQELLSRFIQ